jgi:transcriptional regulator with XRE-family HTH domain
MNQFGEAIRNARLQQSISLREAAKRLDISAAYLSQVENNTECSTPNEELLQRMSKLLKISFSELKVMAAGISRNNLHSLSRVIAPNEAQDIQAFYRVAKQNKLSTKQALNLFIKAADAASKQLQQRAK